MKLQYQGSSSSLYASPTCRHKSDILTNSGGRTLIKPLWCKDRSEYTLWNSINANIQIHGLDISHRRRAAGLHQTSWLSTDDIGELEGEWEVESASLLCQRLQRKIKKILCVIDCGRGASNFPPHVQSQTHQAAEQRRGLSRGLSMVYRDTSGVNWSDWALNM